MYEETILAWFNAIYSVNFFWVGSVIRVLKMDVEIRVKLDGVSDTHSR